MCFEGVRVNREKGILIHYTVKGRLSLLLLFAVSGSSPMKPRPRAVAMRDRRQGRRTQKSAIITAKELIAAMDESRMTSNTGSVSTAPSP